jgi:hypothetical protein
MKVDIGKLNMTIDGQKEQIQALISKADVQRSALKKNADIIKK